MDTTFNEEMDRICCCCFNRSKQESDKEIEDGNPISMEPLLEEAREINSQGINSEIESTITKRSDVVSYAASGTYSLTSKRVVPVTTPETIKEEEYGSNASYLHPYEESVTASNEEQPYVDSLHQRGLNTLKKEENNEESDIKQKEKTQEYFGELDQEDFGHGQGDCGFLLFKAGHKVIE